MNYNKPAGLTLPNTLDDIFAYPPEGILYEASGSVVVRALPGIVIKCEEDLTDEVRATHYARTKARLPAPKIRYHPRPRQTKRRPFPGAEPFGCGRGIWYMCMDECPVKSLDKVIDSMTPADLDHIADQLMGIPNRMSQIKSSRLGTVQGGPYRNMFYPDHYCPKHSFESVGESIDSYHQLFLLCCTEVFTESLLSRLPRNASITFTHGDLLPKNIIVDGTTITGVID